MLLSSLPTSMGLGPPKVSRRRSANKPMFEVFHTRVNGHNHRNMIMQRLAREDLVLIHESLDFQHDKFHVFGRFSLWPANDKLVLLPGPLHELIFLSFHHRSHTHMYAHRPMCRCALSAECSAPIGARPTRGGTPPRARHNRLHEAMSALAPGKGWPPRTPPTLDIRHGVASQHAPHWGLTARSPSSSRPPGMQTVCVSFQVCFGRLRRGSARGMLHAAGHFNAAVLNGLEIPPHN